MPYSINPDRLKPWNELPSLPLEEELYRDINVFEQLAKANSAIGKLQGRSIAIPNQGLLINSISLQEAKASSAIENIFTTDDELYRAFSEQNVKEIYGAPKEVLKYKEALWKGFEYLKTNHFDLNYFIEAYREIKQTNDSLRPPFAQITIRQTGTEINAGQVIYTPPRGKGILEEKLTNLIDFANNKTLRLDPLLKMAISHFQFEAIHPFRDGNGRVGRVFNVHLLVKEGVLDLPILFLSRYIIENKEEYYARLAGVSQRGDWKHWLIYMLRAVEATSNITFQKINDILSTKEAILDTVEKESQIRRPEQLVELIFTQPITKVKHLTDSGAYAENTARNYLNILSDMGVLEKKTVEGHHYYVNLELYRILAE